MGKILQLSLEKDPGKSWCRIKNFLKPKKHKKTYPTLTLDNKTAKTNADKAESVERHCGIECNSFDDTNLREINQFVEANPHIFTPLDSTNDSIDDKDDNYPLVADVDPMELINIVKFDLRKGKTLGHNTITYELLRLVVGIPFSIHLAKLFTFSLKIGYNPTAGKLAILCMLIKHDKLPSLTTSYRPISVLSTIMKHFERVIEKRLRKHLEDTGFLGKYQSGFRKAKSTNDHLLRLSQTVMESFNRDEQVIISFLDAEKAFDSVWHNGLRYKIFQLRLPT